MSVGENERRTPELGFEIISASHAERKITVITARGSNALMAGELLGGEETSSSDAVAFVWG